MRIIVIAVVAFAAAFAGHVAESGEDPAQAMTPGGARAFATGMMADAATSGADVLRDAVPFEGSTRSQIRRHVDDLGR